VHPPDGYDKFTRPSLAKKDATGGDIEVFPDEIEFILEILDILKVGP
jgi:hypothetical protein